MHQIPNSGAGGNESLTFDFHIISFCSIVAFHVAFLTNEKQGSSSFQTHCLYQQSFCKDLGCLWKLVAKVLFFPFVGVELL